MPLTRELHIIRAHHLHYSSLLDDLAKHVIFIRDTHNPALESLTPEEHQLNRTVMERECTNLLTEIKRLNTEMHMQERRLKNVMDLVSAECQTLTKLHGYKLILLPAGFQQCQHC